LFSHLQFEDFQNKWALKLLQKYRTKYRMFNDDVQVNPRTFA
jgi:malate dehydrogenase (decarboxylating)